ncbi:hypothetical protein [Aurantimonas sp. A3-2-R12]|uniref:hypothetical protein n=1 Tax=Aurantimonas sp. A3-2-R12 TaxID=3114362 RepID=UPI002E190568|nr:hypothetical protein [Aurantimonas sp. A3-2-R12]
MSRYDAILDDIEAVALSEKVPISLIEWVVTKKAHSETLALSAPLSCNGVQVSGARLEMHGPRAVPMNRPFYGLVALLFATVQGVTYHLGRIEFDPENPLKPHRNRMGPHKAPPIVQGAQIHRFASNRYLGVDAFKPEGELPIAFPLTQEFVTFDDVLKIVRNEFVIPDLWVEEPGWSRTLV